jgi:hypothetical protein
LKSSSGEKVFLQQILLFKPSFIICKGHSGSDPVFHPDPPSFKSFGFLAAPACHAGVLT